MLHSKLLARIVLSSSTYPVVLHSLPRILLLPMWIYLILFSSCWLSVMSPPDASACPTAICSSSLFPGSIGTSPCTSLNSSSFPLFHPLGPGDSFFVCIHPCFSRQGFLNDRSDSFSTFVIMWFDRFSMRCQRCTTWTTSSVTVSFDVSRQLVEYLLGSASGTLCTTLLGNGGPAPSMSAVTFSVNFNSAVHLPRSATQAFPVRRFPSLTQCLSRPTFAAHNSVLGNAQNYSCSIMMTDKDSVSHAACK